MTSGDACPQRAFITNKIGSRVVRGRDWALRGQIVYDYLKTFQLLMKLDHVLFVRGT